MITPVILCGGVGSRLWPLSRPDMPKQFVPLLGDETPLQEALLRVADPERFAPPVIVTTHPYRFIAAEQVRRVGREATILLEPLRRDSGMAIASVVAWLEAEGSGETGAAADPTVLVLAADHKIEPREIFVEDVLAARGAAEAGHIVTFGVTPTAPETGFGYIEPGESVAGGPARKAQRFIEKPKRDVAEGLCEAGCFWNSGNFLFKNATMREALAAHAPDLLEGAIAAVAGADRDLEFLRLGEAAYAAVRPISIDYAVMEKAGKVAVLPVRHEWSDVGSWEAVWKLGAAGPEAMVTRGSVHAHETRGAVAFAAEGVDVALVGLEDVVVVATGDAVLVADRARSQDVKALHARMEAAGVKSAKGGRRVLRPWGDFESIDQGARYQVKRITVSPGQKLSLQRHFHRAEHWVVVRGTAEVTRDEETIILHENDSVYLPIGCVHRLVNPGIIDLELIEVQVGSYLGEDDIVRIEDIYQRDSEE
ncbi:MAG: mannose-1-phosphate guanylyltransferase/mannose-6-phosphate isomerase [Pseudomonadota bacterium]